MLMLGKHFGGSLMCLVEGANPLRSFATSATWHILAQWLRLKMMSPLFRNSNNLSLS